MSLSNTTSMVDAVVVFCFIRNYSENDANSKLKSRKESKLTTWLDCLYRISPKKIDRVVFLNLIQPQGLEAAIACAD